MNDLIIPALIVGALYLMMKKPSYVLVANALAEFDMATETEPHPDLYIPTGNPPTDARGFILCYTKMGSNFVITEFFWNPMARVIEFRPANPK
jgi:hypothetical protein